VFTVVHRRLHTLEARERAHLAGRHLGAHRQRRARSLRRKGEHVSLDDGLSDDGLSAQGPDPLDQAMRRQARSVVDSLLLGLDDAQREVFVLAEMEGLTGPEISEALNVKLNTVYSRLRLAREHLKPATRVSREERQAMSPLTGDAGSC